MSYFHLFFIGIENLFYNIFQKTKEFFIFFPDLRFFFLDLLIYFTYFFKSPFSLRDYEGQNLPVTYEELTYGEIYYFTAREILKKVNFKAKDLLVDMGSGRGKMVFFASLYFKGKARGIEIMPSFVKTSKWIAGLLKLKNVEFIEEDFRKVSLKKASVIYIAGTCLSDSSVEDLLKALRTAPEGAKIITLSYPLKAPFLKEISKEEMYFSWGKSRVFFHEKIRSSRKE